MDQNKNQEKSISLDSKQVPKWLQGTVNSGRGELEIDRVEDDGDARDTARGGVSYKWKMKKRAERKIKEMEELHDWAEKKAISDGPAVDNLLDGLDKALNSMVD